MLKKVNSQTKKNSTNILMLKRRILKYSEAIREATFQSIKADKKVVLMGLGVDDPKGIFGTTLNIKNKFPNNVYDLPTAENTFTGISLGLAISGFKPIIVHQRVEFSLLSLEQIFNQIAKWFFMSGGKVPVPLVIRLIIGRGWGQGPQHSQSLESIFAHIPGLKVVCPSNAHDAKGMLLSAVNDLNPVIFFEHRWLHDTTSLVPKKNFKISLNKAKVIKKGHHITLISFSYAVIECLKASDFLKINKIYCEVIDLRSLRPIDFKVLVKSALKTKKVLIVDNGMIHYGISSEVMAGLLERLKKNIKVEVYRTGTINPVPSTKSLAKFCYPSAINILKLVSNILSKKIKINNHYFSEKNPDQPNPDFRGPF